MTGTIRYKDFDLSFLPNPTTGDLRVKTDLDSIKQSLRNLVLTAFGERTPFRQDLGTTVADAQFKLFDTASFDDIQNSIEDIIYNFEPRVEIIDIVNNPDNLQKNTINITIRYNVVNFTTAQEFSVILDRLR